MLDFEIPWSVAEIDAAKADVLEAKQARRRLCSADRLAGFGDDGRVGAA